MRGPVCGVHDYTMDVYRGYRFTIGRNDPSEIANLAAMALPAAVMDAGTD